MTVERYEGRELSLLNPVTDSWTAVLEQVADLAVKIAPTDFVPDGLRGKPGQVAAAILHGRELGLAPMTALASTHVIKGKPAISAEAMRALVQQAGHELGFVESTSARCTARGRRRGDEDWTTVTWTIDDARQAGLMSNNQWKTYPRQMLTARASVELCRMIFADVIHGMRALEEMDDVTPWEGPAREVEQVAGPATTKVRRARKTADAPTNDAASPAPSNPEPDPVGASTPEQGTPERRRPALPTRGRRPESETAPPVSVPDSTDAGADDSAPTAPASPSLEEQQAEFRQLAEQHRGQSSNRQTTPEPADAEPVDAEVIDTADRRQLSPGQRATIMMHFARLKVEDRAMRLTFTLVLSGRDQLTSTNELTFSQASDVIKALEQCRDLDALEALVNGQDTLT
ncbi:hypothetical protein [Microlunatus parietis]|uniref:RecT family protein n=1 Tax=Microlunatus parietis TaxID=682979 RepID=A0A7Y9I272_9ACTN|nr:hypothetical protein [Microlunatus parietis]NYE68885.1 hypothetical protein [Microlunatus parietis]